MIIENIYLENFRNYESQKIKLSPGKNIFFGLNGQGKTNVIEAIYYFCTCKSFRSIHDKEIIRFDSDYSHIRIDFSDNKRKNTADIYITDKKSVKVNGINLEKLSEIIGSINMVIFTPEHLNLVREGPGTRRNFLDVLISQIKPMYFKYLMNYYKVLKQRNNILKNRKMLSTIEVWDEKLVQYGVKICEYRKEAINRMNKFIEKFESENEKFFIEYSPSIKNNFTDLEVFLSQLKSGLERDIEKGMTMTGPHRDDFDVILNGKSLKKYGSQGQTRTGVLKIKLAECEIIKDITGEEPILLLDDVLSELDEQRRKYFINNIEGRQVIITCTDRSFAEDENAAYFYVKDGKVEECK